MGCQTRHGWRRLMRGLPIAAVLLLLASASFAQTAEDATPENEPARAAFAGVLQRLHDRGRIVIGYRDSAFPFSYRLDGRPVGYTIDLCLGVVGELARTVDRHLRVDYVPVAVEARLDAVKTGRIDLECGSTTANAERHRVAAFSPIIFLAGTKLLVRRGAKLHSYHDLDARRTIVMVAGTSNEQVVRHLAEQGRIAARIVTAPDLGRAFAMVRDGHADAMAGDDVLLRGLIASDPSAGAFAVVGHFLSDEPYGIMFAKDDSGLADAVGRAFARMAKDGDLIGYYDRWFNHPTPGGPAMRMPMSVRLAEMFHLLGTGE